jgi:hypothetical protein
MPPVEVPLELVVEVPVAVALPPVLAPPVVVPVPPPVAVVPLPPVVLGPLAEVVVAVCPPLQARTTGRKTSNAAVRRTSRARPVWLMRIGLSQ